MKKLGLIFLFLLLLFHAYCRDKQGIAALKTENKIIPDICYSAQGIVIGITDNREIKVYRTDTKALLREYKNGHRGQILALDISKDSTLMVSGGKDSTIILWDFIKGDKLKSLHYHNGLVTSLEISPDGKHLISGGTDDKVFLYDIASGSITKEFSEHKDDITSVAFSCDGKLFAAAGGDKLITVYNTESARLLTSLSGHTDWVRDISFSNDGKRLISCGDDARIIKWDIADPDNIRNISEKRYGHKWILTTDNNEDGNTYAFANLTGQIKILWLQGIYKGRLHVPVNRILFTPGSGNQIKIAVATRGKGVLLINGEALNYK